MRVKRRAGQRWGASPKADMGQEIGGMHAVWTRLDPRLCRNILRVKHGCGATLCRAN